MAATPVPVRTASPEADRTAAIAPSNFTGEGQTGVVFVQWPTRDNGIAGTQVNAVRITPMALYAAANKAIAYLTDITRLDSMTVTASDLRAAATSLAARTDVPKGALLADVLRDAATRGQMTARAAATLLYLADLMPVLVAGGSAGEGQGPEILAVNSRSTFAPLGAVIRGVASSSSASPIFYPPSAFPTGTDLVTPLGNTIGDLTERAVPGVPNTSTDPGVQPTTMPSWLPWVLGGAALLLAIVVAVALFRAGKKSGERAALAPPSSDRQLSPGASSARLP